MKTLSSGLPATFKSYRSLFSAVYGEDNAAVRWIEEQAKEAGSLDHEVFANEADMLSYLATLAVSQ